MITVEDILAALTDLNQGGGWVIRPLDDAWYSARSITRAIGGEFAHLPTLACVRAGTPGGGMLELHPGEATVQVNCYCCFGADDEFNKGAVPLVELKAKVESLRDHYCPPWPG